MQRYILILCMVCSASMAAAQELYIMTEPASNMPANSIGVRLTNKLMPMQADNSYSYRLEPEIMFGINKNLMMHANLYASNMFTNKFIFEGGSAYAKYRFMSLDDVHSHFRMAAFGKLSLIKNPPYILHTEQHNIGGVIHEETSRLYSNEIDLDGNNSGASAGIIATQLLHKVALSATTSFARRWTNLGAEPTSALNNNALNYSLSAGYLLFPRTYKNYRQTNVNLYAEFLGSSGLDKKGYYIDMAPGLQFILNSISRIDIACRTQIAGDMTRFNKTTWLLRFEYNFLNVSAKKQHERH